MKTALNSFIFTVVAISGLSPIVVQAQQVQAQPTRHAPIEIKAQAVPRIEQVILKNGPLADFYDLVSQHTSPGVDLSQANAKENPALIAEKEKARDLVPPAPRKELDKLPQHSAK